MIKLNPSILQHHQIPKPLHGISPRNIMGKYWWDETRHEVFYHQDFRCIACGIHKNDARYHQWLECHEVYDINYDTGEVKFIELVGLCPSCHKFIHSGLLSKLYQSKQISEEMYIDIMSHGMQILKDAGLETHVFTQIEWLYNTKMMSDSEIFEELSFNQQQQYNAITKTKVNWKDWHLLFKNKKYYSKFNSSEEWKKFYINKKSTIGE